MTAREVIKLLREDGWVLKSVSGSHEQYVHPSKPGKVTVPRHGAKDLKRGTLNSILKQAGLK
jgi:predicted RNA binding protein YcfA (HicA-like mRNA interferase family)